jgi:hypothetical protein
LITRIIFGDEYRSLSSSLCSLLHSPVASSLLGPISSSAPYSGTHSYPLHYIKVSREIPARRLYLQKKGQQYWLYRGHGGHRENCTFWRTVECLSPRGIKPRFLCRSSRTTDNTLTTLSQKHKH